MKKLDYTNRFKRDYKRIQKRSWRMEKLQRIVHMLQTGEILAPSARPHKLSGEWLGFWECHIETYWLLVYDVADNAVLLAGTGTHADLFE